MPPGSVHFNGSVNLPDTETVMRELSSRVPAGIRRMTDGETGERGYWIIFQIAKFAATLISASPRSVSTSCCSRR